MKVTKEHIGKQVRVATSPGEFHEGTRKLLAILDEPINGCPYVVTSKCGKGVRVFSHVELDEPRRSFISELKNGPIEVTFTFKSASYEERQKASGFKVGDYVRVTRAANALESDWPNSWVSSTMDQCVGRTFRIVEIDSFAGIRLSNDKLVWFPYSVLEKVTDYKAIHQACDIKPGEWVKVTHAWKVGDFGIRNSCKDGKEQLVGKIYQVSGKHDGWNEYELLTPHPAFKFFPAFAIERVPTPKNPTMLTQGLIGGVYTEEKTGNRLEVICRANVGTDILAVVKRHGSKDAEPFLIDFKKLFIVD